MLKYELVVDFKENSAITVRTNNVSAVHSLFIYAKKKCSKQIQVSCINTNITAFKTDSKHKCCKFTNKTRKKED